MTPQAPKTSNIQLAPGNQPLQATGEFRGQYFLDALIAGSLLLVLLPLIVLRATLALLVRGQLIEQSQSTGQDDFEFPRFAGNAPGAGLVALFGVTGGRFTLVEPPTRPRRPGLFSSRRIRQDIGVEYLEDATVESTWGIRPYFTTLAKSLLAAFVSPARPVKGNDDFHLFGVQIRNAQMSDALDSLKEILGGGRQAAIGFVNADCMNKLFEDDQYHKTLKDFDDVYPDGIGVRMAARMFGHGVKDNINGTDLFPLLCERLAASGDALYLLGAREGIAEQVAENMQQSHPGLVIAGCHHGYFEPEDEDDIVAKINRSGAQAVLVALGAPAQEMWIARNRVRLNAKLLMGVGGLFDYYSGRIERAPVWIREIGMEWVWRLMQEPGRMWRRYVIGNPLFLYRAWSEKRRNGAIARSTTLTPSEEAILIGHFGSLDQAVTLRPHLMKVKRALWRLPETSAAFLKRLMDVMVSTVMLLLLMPLFALVMLSIRLDSPGPVFYSQMRVGYRGNQFRLWKFRSMHIDADARMVQLATENEMEGGVIFKLKQDPRITRVGRIIRKTSIDELPQLWNVLKGEMSLVGPRPALAGEVEQYTIEERVRLMAKPGLTCIWQVSGRSDIPFHRQVQLDEDYLYSQSAIADIKLLMKTIPAVIRGKGAY